MHPPDPETLLRRQRAFGYTDEDLRMILAPWHGWGGADWVDGNGLRRWLVSPISRSRVLTTSNNCSRRDQSSDRSIREEMVMSLISYIGSEGNILEESAGKLPHVEAGASSVNESRIGEAAARVDSRSARYHTACLVSGKRRGAGLKRALDELCRRASFVREGRIQSADLFRSRRR